MTESSYLDYIRIATWDDKTALDIFALLRRQTNGWRPAKWLQYNGWRNQKDGCFYGTGEQNARRHYVVDQSGPGANEIYNLLKEYDKTYCTRIDVQVTILEPGSYNPFITYKELRAISKRSNSIIHSSSGATIYIGARTGQTFARLYQKRLPDADFLRLEFEIKGKKANAVYLALKDGTSPNSIFSHYLKKVKIPEQIKEWFRLNDDTEIHLKTERIHSADKQLNWLYSLESTIVRMGNDHYQSVPTRDFLERCLALVDKKDIIL